MTYCVGMLLSSGLVMLSDSRTNAGMDHISTFRKTHIWEEKDDRVIILMTAGNLSISQTVVNLLKERIAEGGEKAETVLNAPSMFRVAQLVGEAVGQARDLYGEALEAQASGFNVSLILGGQIKGRGLRLFQIYSAGNFIEASVETPFFQIGETKYGKPILDRVLNFNTTLTGAVKLGLISMDSTLRSNTSVGPPLNLTVYERDSLELTLNHTIQEDDPYFNTIRHMWSDALANAYMDLPEPDWRQTALDV